MTMSASDASRLSAPEAARVLLAARFAHEQSPSQLPAMLAVRGLVKNYGDTSLIIIIV